MNKIKPVDLSLQFADAYRDMIPTPEQILESGNYIGGPVVEEFENAFARYCDVAYGIGTSSGTSALTTAFAALIERWAPHARWGGPRMRVITQANTFVATANAALRIPGVAVQVIDCDEYFGMSVSSLQEALGRNKDVHKASWDLTIVVPVHMYGMMCDMQSIVAEVNKHEGVFMVEDCSHAHGSSDIDGRKAGSYGDLAAFSLFPAKPLGATGDAGIVVTKHQAYADFARSYINVGRGSSPDEYKRIGFTYRLDAVHATVLRAKLRRLDEWRHKRMEIAETYMERLWNTSCETGDLYVPNLRPTVAECAWYGFPLLVSSERRDALQQHLFEQGIHAKPYYPAVVTEAACMATVGDVQAMDPLTKAKQVCAEVLCIPIHEFLTDTQVRRIVREVAAGLKE